MVGDERFAKRGFLFDYCQCSRCVVSFGEAIVFISEAGTGVKNSPAQIRTGVKGSKGPYAWPLHSAENNNLIFLHRASGRIFTYFTRLYNLKELTAATILSVGSSIHARVRAAFFFCACWYFLFKTIFLPSLTSVFESAAILARPVFTRYFSP
jgi:hypothetical protein